MPVRKSSTVEIIMKLCRPTPRIQKGKVFLRQYDIMPQRCIVVIALWKFIWL